MLYRDGRSLRGNSHSEHQDVDFTLVSTQQHQQSKIKRPTAVPRTIPTAIDTLKESNPAATRNASAPSHHEQLAPACPAAQYSRKHPRAKLTRESTNDEIRKVAPQRKILGSQLTKPQPRITQQFLIVNSRDSQPPQLIPTQYPCLIVNFKQVS
jgi:hypothetical protein